MVAGRTFCRLTVLAPRTRVDVALPVDVPVADLVPMLLELVGEPRGNGWQPVPWRLSGAAGGSLPVAATLEELAVPDGEMLRLAPVSLPPPAPVFDDPVDALATSAADVPALGGRFGAGAVLVVAAAAAAICAAPGPGSPSSTVVAGLAAVAALWAAFWLARRPPPAPDAARTAALVAVPAAAAAGWTALPPMAGGLLAHLLLAVAAAGVAATVAQVVVRVVAPALIAVVVAAVVIGGGLIGMRIGATPQAATAAIAALAIVVGPLLPRAAIRLAGLPRPVVPGDPDPGDGGLSPAELADRAALARGYLGGLAGGCAVAVSAGAVVTAALDSATGGWVGTAFAAAAVTALGLRSRGYADAAPARTTLAAALAGGIGVAIVLGLVAGAASWTALAMLVICAAGVLAQGRATSPISPVTRRMIDMVEGVLVVTAVPLALGAMGVYEIVRGL